MLTRLVSRTGLIVLLVICVLAWITGRYQGTAGGRADTVTAPALSETSPPSLASGDPDALVFRNEEERLRAFAGWRRRLEARFANPGTAVDDLKAAGRLFAELDLLSDADLKRFVQEALQEGGAIKEDSANAFGAILLALFARRDPSSALDMGIAQMETLIQPGASGRANAVAQSVFMKLASTDPSLTWARWQQEAARQPPPGWLNERDQVDMIFRFWARNDFAAALQAATTLDGSLRESALSRLGENLKERFQGEPSAWSPETLARLRDYLREAGETSNPGLIKHLVNRRLAHESGAEAADWVDSLGLPEVSRSRTDEAVAEAWARAETGKDAAAAWSWLLSRRDAGHRAETLDLAVRSWIRPDTMHGTEPPPDAALAACSEWIISQGIGPEAAPAVSVLARAWLRAGEPDAALAWAQSIAEPAMRDATVKHITELSHITEQLDARKEDDPPVRPRLPP